MTYFPSDYNFPDDPMPPFGKYNQHSIRTITDLPYLQWALKTWKTVPYPIMNDIRRQVERLILAKQKEFQTLDNTISWQETTYT